VNRPAIDTAAVRAAHPLPEVVAAAGVDLRRAGRAWVGCCPFHDDGTPSLSVGGVPDRFHCFGCGAAGDVIDFVERLHGLSFTDAVAHLEHRIPGTRQFGSPATVPAPTAPHGPPTERAYTINAMAWAHYSNPVGHAAAVSHLRRRRGLDVAALEARLDRPVVGHAGTGWTTLTDHLRGRGVTDDELTALDLAQPTRRGTLIDSLRDRLIVPVTAADGRIAGLIGRDTSGDPRAPKYRNPTRTVTHDKATSLYLPAPAHGGHPRVVVVEGPLDALAIAAAVAHTSRHDVLAVAAGGVTVSAAQARRVATLTDRPVILAMDGDAAGRDGTQRWVAMLLHQLGHNVQVIDLDPGTDPAGWLAQHGPDGLTRLGLGTTHRNPFLRQPGPELVRAVLAGTRRPIPDVTAALTPLLQSLPDEQGRDLAAGAVAEMTRQGWNPDGAFARALARAALPAQPSRPVCEPTGLTLP